GSATWSDDTDPPGRRDGLDRAETSQRVTHTCFPAGARDRRGVGRNLIVRPLAVLAVPMSCALAFAVPASAAPPAGGTGGIICTANARHGSTPERRRGSTS